MSGQEAADGGVYCLGILVDGMVTVEVGALGRLVFSPGRYVYVGSALGGLGARVRRHLRTSRGAGRAVHWHIDYLLRAEGVGVEAVYAGSADCLDECGVAAAVSMRGGRPVKGFGCGDCRCGSHLFRVDDFRLLSDAGLEPRPVGDFEPGG